MRTTKIRALKNYQFDETQFTDWFQLDNLSKAKMIKTKNGNMIENDSAFVYDIDELTDNELDFLVYDLDVKLEPTIDELKMELEKKIEEIKELIEILPDKGLKCIDSQKICLLQKINEFEHYVNGLEKSDLK